jgi:peptide/nickel transport system substrate-binding protein
MNLITRLARPVLVDSMPRTDGVLREGCVNSTTNDYREAHTGKPGGTLRASTASDTITLYVHLISHGNMQWLGRILLDFLLFQGEQGNIST